MKKKNLSWTFFVIPLFFSMTIAGASSPVTKIFVDPQSYTAPDIGDVFTINVTIVNVTDLYGFQFTLSYDTAILDIAEATIRPFLNEPIYVVMNEADETEGWYELAIASFAMGVNGSGPLVTLTFIVTGLGNCTLDLHEVLLSDSYGLAIPHSVEDGKFATSEQPAIPSNQPNTPSAQPATPFPMENIAIVIVIAIFFVAALYYAKKRILK